MPKAVAIVSTKGGVGKTMLATNLAVASAHSGCKVLVINTDSQQSIQYWAAHRKQVPGLPKVDVMQWTPARGDVHKAIKEMSGWDLIFLDVRGTDSRELRSALLASDVVLTPTTPSMEDFEVLRQETIPLLDRVEHEFPQKHWESRIVINQWTISIHLHLKTTEAMQKLQSQYDFCQTRLRRLADYQSARAVGMGVMEYDRSGKAAKEFKELYSELTPIFSLCAA